MRQCATLLDEYPAVGTGLTFALAVLAYVAVAAVTGTGPRLVPTAIFALVFTVVYVAAMRYWERRNRSSPA
jgi:hypothetical protein